VSHPFPGWHIPVEEFEVIIIELIKPTAKINKNILYFMVLLS
jgi:hypothetical protein